MTQLVKYEAARAALEICQRVDEVKDIRDKAQALSAYARQAGDTKMVEWATEIKVRAERRAGQLLAEMKVRGERDAVGSDRKSLSQPATMIPTLKTLGISRDHASRWQRLAAVPERQFEKAVAAAKDIAGEVTSAFVRDYEKRHARPDAPSRQAVPADDKGLLASVVQAAEKVVKVARALEQSGLRGKKPEEYRERMVGALQALKDAQKSLNG